MHPLLILGVLCLVCIGADIGTGTAHAQTTPLTLTEQEDIADALALNSRLEVMTANILKCTRQDNGDAQHCACAFPTDLQGLKAAYDRTLEKHPDWENATLSFNTPSSNEAAQTTINFPKLKRQFQTCPATP